MYYLSAYAIAVAHGFRGSEEQWLESLKGKPGKSAYEVAVECGFVGTKEEWLETLKGEADLPVAHAAAAAQNDHYAAVGENLPDVHKADGELPAVGVGKQIVFIPARANLTAAPALKLNNGETVEIRLRADDETADTISVPIGALKSGLPITMTFGGTYWLVDSSIGGVGGGNAERVELTQPVTIGETECDNVQDALEAAADALEGKIDEEDVEEVPIVTASDALQQVANDTAPVTPAGVKRIVDEYGGGGTSHIRIFTLDDVTTAEIAALTEDTDNALFLAYNVSNYTPDPEAYPVEYPYAPTLLLLPLAGYSVGSGRKAVFEQDADLWTNGATVRKTVRVTISHGPLVSDPDVKTVEIVQTEVERICPPPIAVALLPAHSQYYSPIIREFSTTKQYAKNEFCYRKPDNDSYTHFYYCKNNAGHLGDWADADFQDYGRILDPTLDASLAAVNWNDYILAAERGTAILHGNRKLYRQAVTFDSTNRMVTFLYVEQNAAAWISITFDVNGATTGCIYDAYSFESAS